MPGNNTGGASFFQKKGLKPGGHSTAITYPDKPKVKVPSDRRVPAVRRHSGPIGSRTTPVPIPNNKGTIKSGPFTLPITGPSRKPAPNMIIGKKAKSQTASRKKAR